MNLPRINNPCPQNYETMMPAKNGRFCANCCKVVVDFTKKTAEEIFQYLKSNTDTCGKFRPSQLQPIPGSVRQKYSLRLKTFSRAIYLVFGALLFSTTSCMGMPADDHLKRRHDSADIADSLFEQSQLRDSLRKDSSKQDSLNKPD
ncbi:MAG: hypothetical protein ABIQ40_11340 [Bacteroidia bacterium]